jgi:hypothetical protein
MAKPVILLDVSIMDYYQWEAWEFTPAATNTPTSWSVEGLPSGMTYNGTTGRINGASRTPGIFTVKLIASNVDGDSDPAFFVVEVRRSAVLPPSSALDLVVNLGPTLQFTAPGADPKFGALLKHGTKRVLRIRFECGGRGADMDLSALSFGFKGDEQRPVPVISGSSFRKEGTGANSFFYLFVNVNSNALEWDGPDEGATDPALMSERVIGLGQISWTETNPFGVGDGSLTGASANGLVTIQRALS